MFEVGLIIVSIFVPVVPQIVIIGACVLSLAVQ